MKSTKLWWGYWALWQACSLIYMALGPVVLLPLALTHSWSPQLAKSPLFTTRTVTLWDPTAALLNCFLDVLLVTSFAPWLWLKYLLCALLVFGVIFGVYDNLEDGNDPPALVNGQPYLQGWPEWLRTYVWCAFRNSSNGMRWLPGAAFLVAGKVAIDKTPGGGYYAVADGRPCKAWKSFRIGWLINLDAAPGWRCWPICGNTKGVAT